MLRKLLKYDMQSIWKIFLFLAGTVLLLSPLGGLAIRFMIQNESETLILLSVFSGFFLFINVMAIMAFSVAPTLGVVSEISAPRSPVVRQRMLSPSSVISAPSCLSA